MSLLKQKSTNSKLKASKKTDQDSLLFFIDDLNSAMTKEPSNDQPVLECIRQMMSEGVFLKTGIS